MASRIRRPDVDLIPISQGDTLTLKRYLTAGEFRELIRSSTHNVRVDQAMAMGGKDVAIDIDPTESAIAMILAYLVDWTFQDFNGAPIVIRDQPRAVVLAAINAIDAETYLEISRVIQKHDSAMRALIQAEKKTTDGSVPPAPILPSVG